MIVRTIKENELMEARNISSLCFEWSHDTKEKTPEEYFKEMMEHPEGKADIYYQDTWAAFTDREEMMAAVSVLPFQVEFDGGAVSMAGIGGVCTYPQFRRHGAVRGIFEKLLPQLYEKGTDFSYLYAFSEQFYGKFGYYPSQGTLEWCFDMKTIPEVRYGGTFSLLRTTEEFGGFEEAYRRYAVRFNMMVLRDQHDWGVLKGANPFKDNRFAYLYRNEAGEALGYLIFEKKELDGDTIMNCREMIFDSFTTLKILMTFAKSFSADYDFVRFYAPVCLQLEHFCKDYSQSGSTRKYCQNGMLRAVCIRDILEKAKYRGSGEAAVRIEDPVIEQNNRCFHIRYTDGVSTEVTVLPQDEGQPDIAMTAGVFAAAVTGRYELEDFAWLEGVDIRGNQKGLSGVFYKKPFYITNFF